jgi:glucose/arabinose dehydrogenase
VHGPGYGHFGSRIVALADGKFVVTNGDRQDVPIRNEAQNPRNGIGKMVRVNPNGSVPADNPIFYGTKPTQVFTLGHRNPQGAAVHPVTGDVWTIEHGPRGGDELNRLQAGKNYGWPVITYGIDYNGQPIGAGITQQAGMEQPVYYWDPSIAPAGMTFYTGSLFPRWQGSLFISALGQQRLVRLEFNGDRVTGEEHFTFGERLRDVAQGPDGSLWLLTDSANGRILKLTPQ